MTEELATPQQIRKLYAVVRNSGFDPKEYIRQLKEEKGLSRISDFPKREMSGLIDEFELESEKEKKEVREKEEKEEKEEGIEEEEKKRDVGEEEEEKKVVEEVGVRLNEIDAIFSSCIAKASKLVSKLPVSEHTRAMMLLEIAKLYFFEVRRGGKRM